MTTASISPYAQTALVERSNFFVGFEVTDVSVGTWDIQNQRSRVAASNDFDVFPLKNQSAISLTLRLPFSPRPNFFSR
jgi:hypothetical protein